MRVFTFDDFVEFSRQRTNFRTRPHQRDGRPQPQPQVFELIPQRPWQPIVELWEKAGNIVGLPVPVVVVDGKQLVERFRSNVQSGQVETFPRGHIADGRFHRVGLAAATVQDPLDDPQVLAVARPEKLAILVGPEPVHVEDLGRTGHSFPKVQPVLEVVGHVVAAERQHGHWVAATSPCLPN